MAAVCLCRSKVTTQSWDRWVSSWTRRRDRCPSTTWRRGQRSTASTPTRSSRRGCSLCSEPETKRSLWSSWPRPEGPGPQPEPEPEWRHRFKTRTSTDKTRPQFWSGSGIKAEFLLNQTADKHDKFNKNIILTATNKMMYMWRSSQWADDPVVPSVGQKSSVLKIK